MRLIDQGLETGMNDMNSSNTALTVQKVSKRFGSLCVLNDISFSIQRKSVFALCGASGSGKTTLIRIISGLTRFDSGNVVVNGLTMTPNTPYPESLYGKIGVVFQDHNLFPHLTALENVTLGLRKVRRLSSKKAIERGMHEMRNMRLADKAEQYPNSLSGGERQRVAIARALAMDPLLLLLDEPTSSLDPLRIEDVLYTIQDLATAGMTMLLVTHNLTFAKHTAQQFGVIAAGDCVISDKSDILDTLEGASQLL